MDHDHLLLIASSIGLLAVLVLSTGAVHHLISRGVQWIKTDHQPLAHFYEDRDGEATEKSIAQASKRTLCLVIFSFSIIGTVPSSVLAGLAGRGLESPNVSPWMETGIWFSLLIQCIALVLSFPTTCFSLSWKTGLTGVITLLVSLAQGYFGLYSDHRSEACLAFRGLQVVISLAISVLCFLIPRRPDVFYKGMIVDRQFTTSLLGWISFSWTELVLRKGQQSRYLTVDDLPQLDHNTRGESLYSIWKDSAPANGNLWWLIFRCHYQALFCQMTITILLTFLGFVPQLALLRILRLLEARQRNEDQGALMVPVVSLGLSVMASATLDTLKYWFSYNNLAIRVQQQLSLAIFNKAVLLNRVFTPEESENNATALSPVNAVAVDVKNIADFLCFIFLVYESPIKLVIASVFLTRLLGWQSLIAGVAVLGLLTWFNYWAALRYSDKQASLMGHRDTRLRLLTEMLGGIRQIKFSSLESRWEEKINRLRSSELQAQWTVCLWQIAFTSIYFVGPILLSVACMSVYAILYGNPTASTAFTAISVMASMEVAMSILPDFISFFLDARVSMERIKSYLSQPERVSNITPSDRIQFHNAAVAWPGCSEAAGTVKDLDLEFPQDQLSIVTGPTGSGKSLLLAAILGEVDVLNGTVSAPAPVPFEEVACFRASEPWVTRSGLAFVSQSTWLQNATVRDNILLGLPLDRERYAKVVFACALEKDLELLPLNDQTEISAKGANLSGGQKWRICLARALYSRSRTLLLDDIFSAVDVHTTEHIYQYVLNGELLQGRTCILVTHHLELCLPRARYLVQLGNGFLKSAEALPESQPIQKQRLQPTYTKEETQPTSEDTQGSSRHSLESAASFVNGADPDNAGKSTAGAVFIKEGGSALQWSILAIAFFGFGGFMLSRSWWVNLWTDDHHESAALENDLNLTAYYLGGYLALSVLACLLGACRAYFALSTAFRVSQRLFREVLSAVIRAPLQWHDTVHLGQILNCFSSDFTTIDSKIGNDLRSTLEFSTDVVLAIVASVIVNPMLLIVSALLLVVYFWYARRFITTCRHMKDVENAAKGPLLGEIDATVSGLSSVRAYGQVRLAIKRFEDQLGRHARAFWHLWLLNRWLAFRVNVIGATLSALSAAMVVYMPSVDPSKAGFAIGFTIDVYVTMALSVRSYVNLEQGMNSMKRVHSLSTIQKEQDTNSHTDLPDSWPEQGKLEVSQLVVQHASHLPPVLKEVSFTAAPKTRVGVVGRTGAGKSSLVLALFRFLEASHGSILVDGRDISRIPLNELRSRLAIIPQHPVLFRGTVRSNLDPFGEYEDSALVAALQAVGWKTEGESTSTIPEVAGPEEAEDTDTEQDRLLVQEKPWTPLAQPIADSGDNLSHGQQQLLCLARAIIRQPKIIILDEATSAVDKATEDLVQQSLQSALGHHQTTLLVIAHRLKTIANSDLVLVMDKGMIIESGTPQELLQNTEGSFRGMVDQDSERDVLEKIILGGS